MEAIILAGGLGTRLKGTIGNIPKPMALVGEKPFLKIILDMLSRKGFSRIILSIGYKGEMVRDYFGSDFQGMAIDYSTEDQPLGTGGAVKLAMKKMTGKYVYVLNGDTFFDFDIDAVEKQWATFERPIIIAAHVKDTSRFGRLDIRAGKIVSFSEKTLNGPGYINAGCYVLKKLQLEDSAVPEIFSLETEYLEAKVEAGFFDVVICSGIFTDIGTPDDFQNAQLLFPKSGIRE